MSAQKVVVKQSPIGWALALLFAVLTTYLFTTGLVQQQPQPAQAPVVVSDAQLAFPEDLVLTGSVQVSAPTTATQTQAQTATASGSSGSGRPSGRSYGGSRSSGHGGSKGYTKPSAAPAPAAVTQQQSQSQDVQGATVTVASVESNGNKYSVPIVIQGGTRGIFKPHVEICEANGAERSCSDNSTTTIGNLVKGNNNCVDNSCHANGDGSPAGPGASANNNCSFGDNCDTDNSVTDNSSNEEDNSVNTDNSNREDNSNHEDNSSNWEDNSNHEWNNDASTKIDGDNNNASSVAGDGNSVAQDMIEKTFTEINNDFGDDCGCDDDYEVDENGDWIEP